ncbi:glutamine synthetase [Candidatus Epulonipiscium fishelsonii]|uniref:Glutamine synthetase n=1 Tax=Candidatus Epulonipiscium fishelsonii TaxID=77094 RepID=A0ACC8XFB2_9FIRM|nr:glutamine synthetase [Epulopiscium sp. SCG-B05WGA-EpuloA1]ONI41902.1 glutamine synthetase [Epulopiscium sp. SCG-B11WGA-EpuloA1]
MEKINLTEIYGKNVFNDNVMREKLPKTVYKQFKRIIDENLPLDAQLANAIAHAMKEWAMERGATHFTHWFQPMNGRTAEKHDSFLAQSENGHVITEFSGKELIRGEADGSSFPSGGLRQTFEARGYTVWDCTSPAFLKEDSSGVALCIPTVFYSHTGEALDKKAPLLRSMEVVEKAAIKVLHNLGYTDVNRVTSTIGAEQEYFLIDKRQYQLRKDLIFTGRTLFGAMPPKGQEMEDHYFGSIKEKIANFMHEIDIELWKLGVPSKTKHNEVAPAQHELAPLYAPCNLASDQNQLIMETLKRVANHYDLACLLHEKPFQGINGSGKHDNWSLVTDTGINVFSLSPDPSKNNIALAFVCAVLKGIDRHADLLRLAATSAGNDHRLGGNEAPPAIISVFLGKYLTNILESVASGIEFDGNNIQNLEMGVTTMPKLNKEASDRNRTSPFAFTGNKFEFRMFPSSGSISDANVVLNTIMAEALDEINQTLEESTNIDEAIREIVASTLEEHGRIIFNGNGYSAEWVEEAKRRGLPDYPSTVDVIPALISDKSFDLFGKYHIYSPEELHSRYEILVEEYYKTLNIEALTMISMAQTQILPSVIKYSTDIANNVKSLKELSILGEFNCEVQIELLTKLTSLTQKLQHCIDDLSSCLSATQNLEDDLTKAIKFKTDVLAKMGSLREVADELETIVEEKMWPIPTYSELLFRV